MLQTGIYYKFNFYWNFRNYSFSIPLFFSLKFFTKISLFSRLQSSRVSCVLVESELVKMSQLQLQIWQNLRLRQIQIWTMQEVMGEVRRRSLKTFFWLHNLVCYFIYLFIFYICKSKIYLQVLRKYKNSINMTLKM